MTPVDPQKIKVGLYLPNGDGKMSPGIHRWSDVLRLAQKTEAAGLDSVWVADHMIFRNCTTTQPRAAGNAGRCSPPSPRSPRG